MEPRSSGLLLIGAGVALAVVGALVYFGAFAWFGRLPGDIRYEGESTRVYIPITSMLLLSALLTLLLNLFRRLF